MAASASSRLLGKGSIYTLATAAPALSQLLITPVLTRALGAPEFGVAYLAIQVMNLAISVLALGLPQIITRHSYAESTGHDGARGLAISGAGIAMVLALLAAVVAGVAKLAGAPVPLAVVLALLAGGLGGGVAMSQALSLARERAWSYVALAFGVSLLAPAAGVAAVLLGPRRAAVYYGAVVAVYVLVLLVALWSAWRGARIRFSRAELASSLRMSLPMIPHQAAIGAATAVATFVAAHTHGAIGTAQQGPAMILSSAPLIIVSALSYAWTPIVLQQPESERGELLASTAADVTWLAALGGGAMALLSPWFLLYLASAKAGFDLGVMVPIAAVASLTAAIASVFLAHSQLVFAAGRTAALAVGSPLCLLGGLGVSLVATRLLGLTGVAVGYVATYALLWAFLRWLARRVTPVRWSEAGLLVPIGLAAAVCLLGARLPWTGIVPVTVRLVGALGLLTLAGYRFLATLRGGRVRRRVPKGTEEG